MAKQKIFEDFKFEWRGEEVTIPSNRVLGAIARVEQVLTMHELFTYIRERGSPPTTKLAEAWGSLLRYAKPDTEISDDEVWNELFSGDTQRNVIEVANRLTDLLIPPKAKAEAEAKRKAAEEAGKQPGEAGGSPPAAAEASSSEKPIWPLEAGA